MSDEAEGLVSAWEQFSVPLRMKDGPDDLAFEELMSALRLCACAWRGLDSIPRLGANVLVDIVPTMEVFSSSYSEPIVDRLREMMYALQELVWECVAVDSDPMRLFQQDR